MSQRCRARRTAGSVGRGRGVAGSGLRLEKGWRAPPATPAVGGRAAQPLQRQKAIRQEAQRRVVVEARPGAPLEVVQAQFLFELLIALLDVPAASSTSWHRVHQRWCWPAGWTARSGSSHRVRHSTSSQRASASAVGHVVGSPSVLPAVRRPHPHPGELGLQGTFGALPPTERRALQLLPPAA